jgi:hypothetical protein
MRKVIDPEWAQGKKSQKTNPAEIEKLIEQIRGTNPEPSGKDKIERLLRTTLALVELLQRKNTSINKLQQMIFGKRTEKHPTAPARKAENSEKANESEKSAETERARPPRGILLQRRADFPGIGRQLCRQWAERTWESNDMEQCEAIADAAMGIFLSLMRLAIGGEVTHIDDTWVRSFRA